LFGLSSPKRLGGVLNPRFVGESDAFAAAAISDRGGLALVLIGPLFLNNYSLDILTLAGIYIVLALGSTS
jgi:hypothetical protein